MSWGGGGWRWGGCVFFFQAEDGIRDYDVTGVQTCALPIWTSCFHVRRNDSYNYAARTDFIEVPYCEFRRGISRWLAYLRTILIVFQRHAVGTCAEGNRANRMTGPFDFYGTRRSTGFSRNFFKERTPGMSHGGGAVNSINGRNSAQRVSCGSRSN